MARNWTHLGSPQLRNLAVCLLMASTIGSAQVRQSAVIRGRIMDDSTHLPVANANVFIASSMLGTSSDSDGYFRIENIPPGVRELVASCVGYRLAGIKVELVTAADTTVDLMLVPNIVKMGVVEVTAPDPVEWRKNLEVFKQSLLGSTSESEECTFINPEVLSFSVDASGRFVAQSDSTLIIDNHALGYRLHLSLGAFRLMNQAVSTAMKVRFQAMKPADADQESTWQRKRQEAYDGSLMHFLVALANKRVERGIHNVQIVIPQGLADGQGTGVE